ncbi:hypothetical protein M433DRAFT_153456 [Acidomyces richmondensis BFW]|nr:MAG: hypothetical protein FE78DRAFT_89097 [Acidomyces sp. 'richmondensis']KYG46385.1 hypothetical protein M433DRAFT_153456 [Acidomyces richmondensis BFW]
MSNKASGFPEGFLSQPAPKIIANRIDFKREGVDRYEGHYAVILDNVLTQLECDELLSAAEASTAAGWERAMINIGGGQQRLMTESRNCGRIIWDSSEVISKIWKRIEHVPEVREINRIKNAPNILGNGPTTRGETWKFTRPNERMRFLKYVGGEYFRPHCDGSYETPDGKECSYFTLHLYLNDAFSASGSEIAYLPKKYQTEILRTRSLGGATIFHSIDMRHRVDVIPKAGRILLFQHRGLLHSGDDVVKGVKYTMRTDLMYTLEEVPGDSIYQDSLSSDLHSSR